MVSGLGDSNINQVHFSFNGLKTAYPVNVPNSSGTVTVNIPNIVLRYGKDVYMYLCIKNTNGTVVTIKTVIIPVIKRNMPENYMYDDNETVAVKLDELQTEIQRSTGVDTEHETRLVSLEEAKTNANGVAYKTLKERLDADWGDLKSRTETTVGIRVITQNEMKYGVITGSSIIPQYTDEKRFLCISKDKNDWSDNPVYIKVNKCTDAVPLIRYGLYSTEGELLSETTNWESITDGKMVINSPDKIKKIYANYGYFAISILFTADGDKANYIDAPDDFSVTFYETLDLHTRMTNVENMVGLLSGKKLLTLVNSMEKGVITQSGMQREHSNLDRFRTVSFDVDSDYPDNVSLWLDCVTDTNIIPMYSLYFFDNTKNMLAFSEWISCESNDFKVCVNVKSTSEIKETLPDFKYVVINLLFTTDGTKEGYTDTPPEVLKGSIYYTPKEYNYTKPYYVVDKNGSGDFNSISLAITGTNDGDTILVMPGVYEESVHAWTKKRHIVGLDVNTCILTNGTGNYETPPLEMNIGSISNMTIFSDVYAPTVSESDTSRKAYALHIECPNTEAHELRLHNCKFMAKWNSAIGIGVRYNQKVIIDNCEIITECNSAYSSTSSAWIEMGALFFHNDASVSNQVGGQIVISNNKITGKTAALSMYSLNNGSELMAEFINNTIYSEKYGVSDGTINTRDQITPTGKLCGNDLLLKVTSHGNNLENLNN